MEEIIYEKSYREYKAELDNVLEKTAEGFVRIGYLLKVARDTNVLAESGYKTVTEFAQAEYNIDKTQVSRFIHINDRFSKNGYSEQLMDNYKGYGYAKLTLMLHLPDVINEELSPNYSKAEIQTIKEEVEAENKITGIEVLLEGQDATELNDDISKIIDQIGEETPELYVSIHKLLNANKQYDMAEAIRIMAPTGEKTYTVRIRGVGRKMLLLRDTDNEAKIIDVRSNEKTTCTWEEIMDAWIVRMDPEEDAKKDWEMVYGKDYPIEETEQPKSRKQSKVTKASSKKKVAPVQPIQKNVDFTQTETKNKEMVADNQIPGQMNVNDYPELQPDVDEIVDNPIMKSAENVNSTQTDTNFTEKIENVDNIAEIVGEEMPENVDFTQTEPDSKEAMQSMDEEEQEALIKEKESKVFEMLKKATEDIAERQQYYLAKARLQDAIALLELLEKWKEWS